MAYDHGNPQRNTTTVLAVTVLDLNDNRPVISGGANLKTTVSEVRLYPNSRKKISQGGTCLAKAVKGNGPVEHCPQTSERSKFATLVKLLPPHIPHPLQTTNPLPPLMTVYVKKKLHLSDIHLLIIS